MKKSLLVALVLSCFSQSVLAETDLECFGVDNNINFIGANIDSSNHIGYSWKNSTESGIANISVSLSINDMGVPVLDAYKFSAPFFSLHVVLENLPDVVTPGQWNYNTNSDGNSFWGTVDKSYDASTDLECRVNNSLLQRLNLFRQANPSNQIPGETTTISPSGTTGTTLPVLSVGG